MELVPEHRALLGVDVVGAASNPGHHRAAVPQAVEQLVTWSLQGAGIERTDVLEWEATGDGVLLTLPGGHVGQLLDASELLEMAAARRNRRYQPEVRLRVAVDAGPVGTAPGFYEPKIALNRMLEATGFKSLFGRCLRERSDSAHAALIVSDRALRAAFGGDHTSLIRRSDFGSLRIRNKEYEDAAWVRVRGFDPGALTEFAKESETSEGGDAGARSPGVPHGTVQHMSMVNQGSVNGVQAGQIYGGVNQVLRR